MSCGSHISAVVQVQSVVPDQLLLQMLVSWLGPLTEGKPSIGKMEEKVKASSKATAHTEIAGIGKAPQRPPLKVRHVVGFCGLVLPGLWYVT